MWKIIHFPLNILLSRVKIELFLIGSEPVFLIPAKPGNSNPISVNRVVFSQNLVDSYEQFILCFGREARKTIDKMLNP